MLSAMLALSTLLARVDKMARALLNRSKRTVRTAACSRGFVATACGRSLQVTDCNPHPHPTDHPICLILFSHLVFTHILAPLTVR